MIAPTILDRLFEPFAELSPETAQELVDLRLDPALQTRLDELARLANQGVLSPDDREQYEQYVEALDMLAMLKAKARAALNKPPLHANGDS